MCESDEHALAAVGRVTRSDFESTAADAAGHGSAIVGPLMLIARDARTSLVQLCAIKALALSREPLAVEALRRVRALPSAGRDRAVATLCRWSRREIAAPWDPEALFAATALASDRRAPSPEATLIARVAADPSVIGAPEPWEEAEFADGFYREMEGLTREFGDPDWYESGGHQREPSLDGTRLG